MSRKRTISVQETGPRKLLRGADQMVHFSDVHSTNNVSGKHECTKCNKLFKRSDILRRHMEQNCNDGQSRYLYPGGCYESVPTIFDKLLEYGIVVEQERRLCKAFATWDTEAILEAVELKYQRSEMNEQTEQRLNNQNIEVEYVDDAKKLQIRERHRVVTGAIKSTVIGSTETHFFYDADPEQLVEKMFNAMIELSDKNYKNEREKFANEFERLDELQQQLMISIEQAGDNREKQRERAMLKKIERIIKRFDTYCRQLTILTYNGAKYDLNLCRPFLYPKMVKRVREARNNGDEDARWPKAITRGSSVLCLSTCELRILDVMQYVSPGVNLQKFIKTFNPNGQQKGVYPYELIRRPEQLEMITEFPPKTAFYSTLKNATITDEEYEQARQVWYELPKQNMLEYTKWYNETDTAPFLEACTAMVDLYWKNLSIDILKTAQSLPGVTLAYLFKELHKLQPATRFGLFSEHEGQLCQDLYDSICGGLSVIIQRIAIANETPIRGNKEKLVNKCVGFDFNALYLGCMMQEMPTGHGDHWKLNPETNNFERASKTFDEILKERKCHGEVEYMKFKAWNDKIYIHHAEHGPQQCLGTRQYRCDGFAKDAKPRPKVINYNGCFYHCHQNGCLNKKLDLTNANRNIVAQDELKEKELTDMGFDTETMWECYWLSIQRLAKTIRAKQKLISGATTDMIKLAEKYNEYLDLYPKRAYCKQKTVAYDDMKNAILDGRVFGFARVDVQTKPDKMEAYEDFPPVFKHAKISREDIGPYMRNIAEERDELKKPQDALINSFFGEKIFLMTPLLQFYEKHGVEIKHIYEVVQFDREKAFEFFGNTVTMRRKLADADSSQCILAEVYKLLGNAGYGKTVTNLKNHQDVFFADKQEVNNVHNSPYHCRTVPVADDCYELHSRKKSINFNLPFCIGLAVYSYAKLHLLRFLYDVLFEYVDKADYMLLESDTDSIYIAISGDCLEDIVIPEKRDAFNLIKDKWFVKDDTEKRTPGKLKIEQEGQKFCGLNSKCYVVVDDTYTKCSAKGVQQKRNVDILTFENYYNVLFGLPSAQYDAYNIGIRFLNNDVCTYVQCKNGLTRLYCKRICMPDGSTLPLKL